MLQSLRIKNFALIEDLEMTCAAGLNVLTGETGAGKSILIDALNILLGEKAGPAFIRNGSDKAVIEGLFQIGPAVIIWLKNNELADQSQDDDSPDNQSSAELFITREITKTGSRFRINGVLVNQALLVELKQMLIHMHAQHEARTLLSSQFQLNILDGLADAAHFNKLAAIKAAYEEKAQLQKELAQLQMSEEDRIRKLDFARFHLEELQNANLKEVDEDEQLAAKQMILANVAQLELAAMTAYNALVGVNESDDGAIHTGAIDALQIAINSLERAAKLDNSLNTIGDVLSNALSLLEEGQISLRHYKDNLEADPEAMQEIDARVAQLATIKRKYGPTLAQATERLNDLKTDIEQLDNVQNETNKIESKLKAINKALEVAALAVSQTRQNLAALFTDKMKTELAELGMERCQFEITFNKSSEIGATGFDRIEFMISPNPGQPLLPLAKIASGGELSRIMLALKTIVAGLDDPPTIVFDEIDAGLSGRIVQAVRDKLAALAQARQILCITHQPIIAAAANNHLFIEKRHSENTTNVTIRILTGQDRVKALAAMASGDDNEAVALDFAQALINQQSSTINN